MLSLIGPVQSYKSACTHSAPFLSHPPSKIADLGKSPIPTVYHVYAVYSDLDGFPIEIDNLCFLRAQNELYSRARYKY